MLAEGRRCRGELERRKTYDDAQVDVLVAGPVGRGPPGGPRVDEVRRAVRTVRPEGAADDMRQREQRGQRGPTMGQPHYESANGGAFTVPFIVSGRPSGEISAWPS